MPHPATVFIGIAAVEGRIGLKKTAVYRLMREGKFPRPVRLTGKAVRWVVAEIDDWQRERLAERDRDAA